MPITTRRATRYRNKVWLLLTIIAGAAGVAAAVAIIVLATRRAPSAPGGSSESPVARAPQSPETRPVEATPPLSPQPQPDARERPFEERLAEADRQAANLQTEAEIVAFWDRFRDEHARTNAQRTQVDLRADAARARIHARERERVRAAIAEARAAAAEGRFDEALARLDELPPSAESNAARDEIAALRRWNE